MPISVRLIGLLSLFCKIQKTINVFFKPFMRINPYVIKCIATILCVVLLCIPADGISSDTVNYESSTEQKPFVERNISFKITNRSLDDIELSDEINIDVIWPVGRYWIESDEFSGNCFVEFVGFLSEVINSGISEEEEARKETSNYWDGPPRNVVTHFVTISCVLVMMFVEAKDNIF